MRVAYVVVIVVALGLQHGAAANPQRDPLIAATFSCGAWCEATASAINENVGLSVSINSSANGSQCHVPDDLLVAEAESVLRQFGFVVRPGAGAINGGVINIGVVALETGSRCATSFQMMFSITRLLRGLDDRDPYFANIVVDESPLLTMVHPVPSHRQVLRSEVNNQMTVWANELANRMDENQRAVRN